MKSSALNSHAVNAAVATLPFWQGNSGSFTYRMIGTDPTQAGAGTTTIPTNVVPVILTFADGTVFDPTVPNSCSWASPLALVLSSPLFNNSDYTLGGTDVGNTQFADFFQRANFWQFTGPGGVSPNYHVLLNGSPVNAVTITVPSASGSTASAPCGRIGEMDINWFDHYLQSTVFPQLASAGVQPSSFPVFVVENVVMYDAGAQNCCILGYHSGFNSASFSNAVQTYAVADFETSGSFGSTADVAPLSHEIAEWLDDPTGNNTTPPWGNIGQVSACESDLEVGDPLSGNNFAVTMSNSYTYHLQEEAFKSWFYREAPSTGVNGWYSSNGTFRTPASGCNAPITTLSITPTVLLPGAPVSVSITVAPKAGVAGTPTGTVSLLTSLNTTPVATWTLSGGAVNATTTALPSGSYNVTAHYSGDSNFGPGDSAPVTVTVGAPSVTLRPVSLMFAGTSVGASAQAQNVTLWNQGTADLAVSSISFSGASPADFTQTNNCGKFLAVNGSCSIVVTFTPKATGTRTALLTIADNAAGSPQTVVLSGTATTGAAAGLALSTTALDFGSVAVGTSSPFQSFTLTNSGSSPVAFASTLLTGADPNDFSGSTSCWGTLSPGASCYVALAFHPGAAGARTAAVQFTDNATGSPQVITLSGTGF